MDMSINTIQMNAATPAYNSTAAEEIEDRKYQTPFYKEKCFLFNWLTQLVSGIISNNSFGVHQKDQTNEC